MSHENRTPMNAIIGMTTIAAAQIGDNARTKDCLEKISFSSKHLLSLINDILDVTTIIYPQAAARGLEFKASVHNFARGDAGRHNAHKPDFD